MNKIKNIICAAVAVMGLSSCNDFLDILPMNDVVLENYWTQKSDVTSVLMGCYESLESSDCVVRMALWGELRSDNMKMGSSVPWEVEQIIKENILPTNSYCKWTAFYQTINRCNTVCHYAPIVHEKDPNYTEAEMRANVAEAVALRSLCYFYLIRTFRDVPFTREPSIDDTQNYQLPATKFDDVLDSLIVDLEAVKDQAVRRYYSDDNDLAYTNSSRITRYAVYALLADLYLWKGDWQRCIDCCDYVLDYKLQQYDELRDREGNLTDMQLFNDIPLIMERPVGSNNSGNAYNEIFGTGNSFESIFELYYRQNVSMTNTYVPNYYGSANGNAFVLGRLSVPTEFYEGLPTQSTQLFVPTDCRAYENIYRFSTATHAIGKYVRQSISFNTMGTITDNSIRLAPQLRSTNYANWIIYRMTDVMLMKAEALIEQGEGGFDSAFDLINAIYMRANNQLTASAANRLDHDVYVTSQQSMRDLLMDERHRELMFEGKRWFDLVRMARREGSTRNLANIVVTKQTVDQNGIKIKLADPNILYYPYYREELKVNPYLVQNPAYATGVDDDLSKN
ncbi:MAG: RagB/SusD family nutrient uptake outer membrane protein [Prevotella sp.]|nr:RagB/SusD family nutrient uptake outer membrane protein [Prevotella sp.]